MRFAEDIISDKILEVANLFNEVDYSDLQGIAIAKAKEIIKEFGRKGILVRKWGNKLKRYFRFFITLNIINFWYKEKNWKPPRWL